LEEISLGFAICGDTPQRTLADGEPSRSQLDSLLSYAIGADLPTAAERCPDAPIVRAVSPLNWHSIIGSVSSAFAMILFLSFDFPQDCLGYWLDGLIDFHCRRHGLFDRFDRLD
jgi:hypothetical protein